MENESATKFWEEYRKVNPDAPKDYVVWAFGGTKEIADELANLVLEGTKTATTSNFTSYEIEKEPLPSVGLNNIIITGEGKAVAIVETMSVQVVPFDEVTDEHAYLEGEGDRTLRYWRDVHESFFKKELNDINQEFHYKIPVVCERFRLIYKRV